MPKIRVSDIDQYDKYYTDNKRSKRPVKELDEPFTKRIKNDKNRRSNNNKSK